MEATYQRSFSDTADGDSNLSEAGPANLSLTILRRNPTFLFDALIEQKRHEDL